MKIVKVGKYYALRHWLKWYWIHQEAGGADFEMNRLEPIKFKAPKEIE